MRQVIRSFANDDTIIVASDQARPAGSKVIDAEFEEVDRPVR